MASQNPIRFPCDACRRRKVRCDYGRPCDRCQSYNIACTFDSVRKKRGPKKGKGAVVEQLRAESRNIAPSPASATPVSPSGSMQHDDFEDSDILDDMGTSSMPAVTPTAGTMTQARTVLSSNSYTPAERNPANLTGPSYMDDDYLTFDEFAHVILGSSTNEQFPSNMEGSYATGSPTQLQNLLSNMGSGTIPATPTHEPPFELNSITERGIDLFFAHMYLIYPILDEAEVRAGLLTPHQLPPAKSCMLLSICAMTLVHVERWPNMSTEQRAVHARRYIRQCQEIRLHVNFVENVAFADVVSSLFIAVTYFELKCRKSSWFFVREAVTLAHAIGLHLPPRDPSLNAATRLREQRTYALLFITERGAAILDNFPVTILCPPDLSSDTISGEDPMVSRGLVSLRNLFSLLDFDFVHLWNNLASLTNVEREFPELSRLQEHLRQDLGIHGLSDTQRADVLITQQWLRLVFWQAALRLGLISSSASESAFAYKFPIEIASALCEIVKSLPPVAIQVHGLGIVSTF